MWLLATWYMNSPSPWNPTMRKPRIVVPRTGEPVGAPVWKSTPPITQMPSTSGAAACAQRPRGCAGCRRAACRPISVRWLFRIVRLSWYTPRCTMIVSPGDASRMARWMEWPGHTFHVAAEAVVAEISNAPSASISVTTHLFTGPPPGVGLPRHTTPRSTHCKDDKWTTVARHTYPSTHADLHYARGDPEGARGALARAGTRRPGALGRDRRHRRRGLSVRHGVPPSR